jgi:uncharacterized protein YegP (UPF0339 family)
MSQVEIYEDEAGGWRWRLTGDNGEVVAVGESYTKKSDASRGWETARRLMVDAVIPPPAEGQESKPKPKRRKK